MIADFFTAILLIIVLVLICGTPLVFLSVMAGLCLIFSEYIIKKMSQKEQFDEADEEDPETE